jgi:hypothetical protein
VPFGYRLGDDDELVPVEAQQEAILEMAPLQAQGLSLRAMRPRCRRITKSAAWACRAS